MFLSFFFFFWLYSVICELGIIPFANRGFGEGYKKEGFYKRKEVDKEVILAKS